MKPDCQKSDQPIRSLEGAIKQCQRMGMRLSRQRHYILELLWDVREHLSAREIYNLLNQKGKEIGHTSVYQNLEALSQSGIIECVERFDGRLYGHVSENHSHVNCIDTKQIIDVWVKLPDSVIQDIESKTGVKITEYRVDFYGYQQTEDSLPKKNAVAVKKES